MLVCGGGGGGGGGSAGLTVSIQPPMMTPTQAAEDILISGGHSAVRQRPSGAMSAGGPNVTKIYRGKCLDGISPFG